MVADMYTALNTDFLKEKRINAVVNLMGALETNDWKAKLFGPTCSYRYDEWDPRFQESVTPARKAMAERYLNQGPKEFYGALDPPIQCYVDMARFFFPRAGRHAKFWKVRP